MDILRLCDSNVPDREDAGGEVVSYTYDAVGNQLTMTDSTGTTTRVYDALNRVLTKDVPGFGVTSFAYDISQGNGRRAETATDPRGHVTTKVYDGAGRLAEMRDGGETTAYSYYENGSLHMLSYPGGMTETYTYYPNNKLHTLVNKRGSLILDAYQYAYDAAGNMTYKEDVKGRTSYAYTPVNQLLTVAEPGGKTTAYTYDPAGNRLTETVTESGAVTVTTCHYDTRNRLAQTVAESEGAALTVTYAYDENGNMVSRMPELLREADPDDKLPGTLELSLPGEGELEASLYTYDNRNRMIESLTGGVTVKNAYNGEGLRVSKTSSGKTVQYLYEYDKIILEKETDGGTVTYTRNVYGVNLISRDANGAKAYYLYNGHHDVVQLMTTGGTLVARYYYDAFGVVVEETGTASNPYRYAGYFFDSESSLYYLKARFYDPGLARFLQEDSYYGNRVEPLSLNLYTYCANNPIVYWDPTGHWSVTGYGWNDWTPDNAYTYDVQLELIALTSAYYEATSDAERKTITAQANSLRTRENVRSSNSDPGGIGAGLRMLDAYFRAQLEKNEKNSNGKITSVNQAQWKALLGAAGFDVSPLGVPYDTYEITYYTVKIKNSNAVAEIKREFTKTPVKYSAKSWSTISKPSSGGSSPGTTPNPAPPKEDVYVSKKQLLDIGWKNVTDAMVTDLNRVLKKYGITTIDKIRHFLAQCAVETDWGRVLLEEGSDSYFKSNGYSRETRGSGYLQLTFLYGQQAFATFLILENFPELSNISGIRYLTPAHNGSNEISEMYDKVLAAAADKGLDVSVYTAIIKNPEYIATNFAWESAGYDWTYAKELNQKMDKWKNEGVDFTKKESVDKITSIINKYTDTYEKRRNAFEKICQYIK